MPLRRTDGKPRFLIAGKKYPGWRYTYNPCTPVDVGEHDPDADPHKICRDVAICKYAEIEKPREYFEVGLQKDIMCDINQEGQIELVYKTKFFPLNITAPVETAARLCISQHRFLLLAQWEQKFS